MIVDLLERKREGLAMDHEMRKTFKDALEIRLKELLRNQGEFVITLSGSINGQDPMDLADMASSHYDSELMHTFHHRKSKVIKEIHSAIRRIDRGEFGICYECSDPIGLERLRVQPTTILCVNCKRELESNSRTRAA